MLLEYLFRLRREGQESLVLTSQLADEVLLLAISLADLDLQGFVHCFEVVLLDSGGRSLTLQHSRCLLLLSNHDIKLDLQRVFLRCQSFFVGSELRNDISEISLIGLERPLFALEAGFVGRERSHLSLKYCLFALKPSL